MQQQRKVLVTGLSGAVGSAVRPALEQQHEVVALSRAGVDGLADDHNFRGDIAEFDSITPAFSGVDTVIHLAADGGVHSTRGMSAGWDSILRNNIIGTRNVFEAASQHGVRRVVFASSGATMIGWEEDEPYASLVSGDPDRMPAEWRRLTHEDEPKPRSYYGVSKLVGEDLGRMYSAGVGPSVICIRIGGCSPANRPTSPRASSIFVSHADIAQLTARCIEAPDSIRFDIFYGVSDNRLSYRDWMHARDVVGYVPQDRAEDFE